MILLIDNYDSFTYNIYHDFAGKNEQVCVRRNDQISINDIKDMDPEAIVISPGPGTPADAGISTEAVTSFHQQVPILGICLGHQVIAAALGGDVRKAKTVRHGKTSRLAHNGNGLFNGLPYPLEVMRYHSLSVERTTLPSALKVTAESLDDSEVMAIEHQNFPVYGIQFHPESIGTANGRDIISHFLYEIRKESRYETLS